MRGLTSYFVDEFLENCSGKLPLASEQGLSFSAASLRFLTYQPCTTLMNVIIVAGGLLFFEEKQ